MRSGQGKTRSRWYLSLTPGDVIERVLDLVKLISEMSDGRRLLIEVVSALTQTVYLTGLSVLDVFSSRWCLLWRKLSIWPACLFLTSSRRGRVCSDVDCLSDRLVCPWRLQVHSVSLQVLRCRVLSSPFWAGHVTIITCYTLISTTTSNSLTNLWQTLCVREWSDAIQTDSCWEWIRISTIGCTCRLYSEWD